MKNEKIFNLVILFLGLAVCIYFIAPDISMIFSSKKDIAKVKNWIVKYPDNSNNFVVFTYKNKYNNQTYEITKSVKYKKNSDLIMGKEEIEIEYNKFFPKSPKIVLITNYTKLILLTILTFLTMFGIYRTLRKLI